MIRNGAVSESSTAVPKPGSRATGQPLHPECDGTPPSEDESSCCQQPSSMRSMRRDNSWNHTLLEEAENERMHLLILLLHSVAFLLEPLKKFFK